MNRFKYWIILASTSLCFNIFPLDSYATGRTVAGEVVSVLGKVIIREDLEKQTSSIHTTQPGDIIYSGDIINTSSNGGVKILFKDKSIIDLGPASLFKVSQYIAKKGGDRQIELDLTYGKIRTAVTQKLNNKSKFFLRTPTAVMGVRGTVAFSEVTQGDTIQMVSKHPNSPTSAGQKVTSSSFFISQGLGVVSNTTSGKSPSIVLKPGDQAISSSTGNGNPIRQTLSPAQSLQKTQQVQNMSRSTDTTFLLATNYDRAVEQKKQGQDKNNSSSSGDSSKNKSSGKSEDSSKSRTPASSATQTGGSQSSSSTQTSAQGQTPTLSAAGSSGSILESVSTEVAQVAPPPPQVTVSNLGIAGAPTTNQILTQQTGTSTVPQIVKSTLTVKVVW